MSDEGDMGQAGIMKKLDQSFWWQSSFFLQKYKVVGLFLVGVATAFGWQYISPNERFNLLAQQQQAAQVKAEAMRAKTDSIQEDVSDVKRILKVLVVIQCLDRPRKELAYMQIDCSNVQQYMDQASKESK